MMTEAKRIFEQALEMSHTRRVEFLNRACGDRLDLHNQVECMLAAREVSSTLLIPTFIPAPLASDSTAQKEPFLGNKRFRIQRRVGAGSFGTVYKVWDREQKVSLAAKVLHRRDAGVLIRFKREFRSARELYHENLVRLNELFSEGDQWFFTMEFVEGENFLAHIRPDGVKCHSDRLRSALCQLARGVNALHRAGWLHRDLKPGNVLVTSEGRVVVLDFGLIKDIDVGAGSESSTLVGTPSYMAPEQAIGSPVTEASDWYAVGVMLFQGVTGELPHARSVADWRYKGLALDQPPPQPRDLSPDVAADLNDLCRSMLEPRPEKRPNGEQIISTLTARSHPSIRDQGAEERSSREVFIGRAEQINTLRNAFSEMKEGQLRVVLVQGRSGMGKTSTIRHFISGLAPDNPGLVVLKGRCYEFESVPYKGLDSLIDELTQYLLHLPGPQVDAVLPRDAALLPTLFPVLNRVREIANAPRRADLVPDDQELRQRTFSALRDLIGRISDRRSVVIWIDDLQWGDRDSSMFLAELCIPPQQPQLLLILTYRSEDVASNATLQYLLSVLNAQSLQGGLQEITIPELSK